MTGLAEKLQAENDAIEAGSPALAACLSALGRRVTFPPDIPFQAAAARGKAFNGTIGQVTDGAGSALALAPMAEALGGLSEGDRNRAFLYSPIAGLPDVREAWRTWQRRGVDDALGSSLPIVTAGLTHGLSLLADLFGGAAGSDGVRGDGHPVAVPEPYWGNYRQTFAVRTGARIVSAPGYEGLAYNPRAIPQALASEPAGEPALAILNLPSNPGGYMATASERAELRAALIEEAERRPLVVICDDAYAGLVYEPDVPAGSMFWDLAGAHPNLVPVKVDGGTKEFSFFGGRVGFLTFPFAQESAAAEALESKVMCLTRATMGSPVAASQIVLLQALREQGIAAQVGVVRDRLAGRYRVLRDALENVDRDLLEPLAFNAGCFALIRLGPRPSARGVDAETVRLHLLEHHDTGLVSIGADYLRIAFCSVKREALPELVRRLERGVAELSERH